MQQREQQAQAQQPSPPPPATTVETPPSPEPSVPPAAPPANKMTGRERRQMWRDGFDKHNYGGPNAAAVQANHLGRWLKL